MLKRHQHVSPTLDLMAKKILHQPDFTASFIQDILGLDVASVEILEGTQIHSKDYLEDSPFMTAVDVRAKLQDGTEVIIEIQVQKQEHFVNRFYYYILKQLVDNVTGSRQKGKTHLMYQEMKPVYGIAVLEKSILSEEAPINIYEMVNHKSQKILPLKTKDGNDRSLLKLAFVELDKYNEDIRITDEWRQWLEFFGNRQFTKKPNKAIVAVEPLLDSSKWTKEEKAMIDERIRIQENYDMSIETAVKDGIKQGFAQGIQQGVDQGIDQERRQLAMAMVAKGLSKELICDIMGIGEQELEVLVADAI